MFPLLALGTWRNNLAFLICSCDPVVVQHFRSSYVEHTVLVGSNDDPLPCTMGRSSPNCHLDRSIHSAYIALLLVGATASHFAVYPITLLFIQSLCCLSNHFAVYPITLLFIQSLCCLSNHFAVYPITLLFIQSLCCLSNHFAVYPITLLFIQSLCCLSNHFAVYPITLLFIQSLCCLSNHFAVYPMTLLFIQ